MSCPQCNADRFYQNVIDEDRDFDATEYECINCGCQYWIERTETVTIEKKGTLEEDE